MRTDIFIRTIARDFAFLYYCLRSIEKFASDFGAVHIVLPKQDADKVSSVYPAYHGPPLVIHGSEEWPDKGFLYSMLMVMRADLLCPQAEFILHLDSDCIFTAPVTPQDYMVDGKPILMHATFEWLESQGHPEMWNWKRAAEAALKIPVTQETMRRHPAVHYRWLYRFARKRIEDAHGMRVEEYVRKQKNEWPQTFAEFPILGAVAWHWYKDKYHWIDHAKEWPEPKVHQSWTHGGLSAVDKALYAKLGL